MLNDDREPPRVLFLDFEGVLNPFFGRGQTTRCGMMCVAKLERLKTVCQQTKCKVVLTSQLRENERDLELLRTDGLHWDDIAPITGNGRKADIEAWLDMNPLVECFAVIDDDPNAWDDSQNLVLTDKAYGLQEVEMEALLKLLG
ncbi:HAD domain-containing protein [Kamptonema cortianum]|nr:HAD domain-containing protein [Geitlerinema splendidum]MDK3156975.1 HAD domain-containing protein [Kamptonema cortianum]